MNIAVIFAGGTGQRMNSRTKPKQFLLVHGKPIIIYTLEAFDQHPDIDAIVVVCLKEYIDVLEQLIAKFGVGKIAAIVPGGSSGQESIRNGVDKANRLYPADSVVIVHDGVRPLIDQQTITDCIVSVKKNGSAVTVVPATETIVQSEDGVITNIIDRKQCQLARAPQCFRLGELHDACHKAVEEGGGSTSSTLRPLCCTTATNCTRWKAPTRTSRSPRHRTSTSCAPSWTRRKAPRSSVCDTNTEDNDHHV